MPLYLGSEKAQILLKQICLERHIWVKYTQREMDKVKVAYNGIVRRFFQLGRRDSISAFLVRCRLPTLTEIIRKNTYSIYKRFMSASNHVAADACHPILDISLDRFWCRFRQRTNWSECSQRVFFIVTIFFSVLLSVGSCSSMVTVGPCLRNWLWNNVCGEFWQLSIISHLYGKGVSCIYVYQTVSNLDLSCHHRTSFIRLVML